MEAPKELKHRKMIAALKMFRESREALFSLDQSEEGKEKTKIAWTNLLVKTTAVGWTNSGQSWVNLKRKWHALSSETQKSIRAKYNKERDTGDKASYSEKERLVIQILTLDIETPTCSVNSCAPDPPKSHIETQTDDPPPRKPATRSQQKL